MVVKDEADRYLQASLTRLKSVCDKVFVADDYSSDNSVEIAKDLGCTVWRRPKNEISFAEHEGKFRERAWIEMGKKLKLKPTDWILSIDADEYFTGTKEILDYLPHVAAGRECFKIPVKEVWEINPLKIRVDGFWRNNINARISLYGTQNKFRDIPMGCGSVPYAKLSTEIHKFEVLHFGYVDKENRKKKYDFYKSLPNHGHNDSHIESIIKKADLEDLGYEVDFWKGLR